MKKDIFTVVLLSIMAIIGSFMIYQFNYKTEEQKEDTLEGYSYYVGYLTLDLIISLFYVWRTSEAFEFDGLSGQEVSRLIDDKITELNVNKGLKLSRFQYDRDVDEFMPKLIEELKDYDLSEANISDDKWNEIIDYLMKHTKN